MTSNQEPAVSRYLYRSYLSLELSKMYRKLSTVRIAPRRSNQRNESQDVSPHNTAFFDDERPEVKRQMNGFCKAIASKAAAFQVLSRQTRYYARCILSKDLLSQKKVSDQTIAFCVFQMIQRPINHRIPCHMNYFFVEPSTRYAVRRK